MHRWKETQAGTRTIPWQFAYRADYRRYSRALVASRQKNSGSSTIWLRRRLIPKGTDKPEDRHYLTSIWDSFLVHFMDHPQTAHRQPTDSPWVTHGQPMDNLRTAHGQPVGMPWAAHGQPTDSPPTAQGQPMGTPCATHGQPTDTHGRPTGSP